MTAITGSEKAAIGALWAEKLEASGGAATGAPIAGVNPRDIFCQDWPTAKGVLQALQAVVPQPGPFLIGLVISAGDAAHSTICK